MGTTVIIVIIFILVIDAKNAIDASKMIGTYIGIPSERRRGTPKTRVLKRRSVEAVIVARRTRLLFE